jgi:hypothetical protein
MQQIVIWFNLLENVFQLNEILFVDSDVVSMLLDKRYAVIHKHWRDFDKTIFLKLFKTLNVTFVSYLCQICVLFVSHSFHIRVIFVSYLCHIRVLFVSHLYLISFHISSIILLVIINKWHNDRLFYIFTVCKNIFFTKIGPILDWFVQNFSSFDNIYNIILCQAKKL